MLCEDNTAGLIVTLWVDRWVSKRGKMSHRDNMSQYGKKDFMKHTYGENVSERGFCHNLSKKGWSFCYSKIRPTLGMGDIKSLEIFSVVKISQWM
jgi:hypothetical protein